MTTKELQEKIYAYHMDFLSESETLEMESLLASSPGALQDYFNLKRELAHPGLPMQPSPQVKKEIVAGLFPSTTSTLNFFNRQPRTYFKYGFAVAIAAILLLTILLPEKNGQQLPASEDPVEIDSANESARSLNYL